MALRFIHISDTHIGGDPSFMLYGKNTYDHLKALVEHLNNLPFTPDFVIHTGDVTNDYEEENMQLAAEVLKDLRFPIYYVVGNHDSRAHMRQYLMSIPLPTHNERIYYDFLRSDFHFLVLDTSAEPHPQGGVTQEQLDWLIAKCSQSVAESLVLFVHHLPLHVNVPWMDDQMRIMNADTLFNALMPHRDRLRGIFFGHIHQAFTGYRDGILCSAAPSVFHQFTMYPTDERPNPDAHTPGGYALVNMTHERTTISRYNFPLKQEIHNGN